MKKELFKVLMEHGDYAYVDLKKITSLTKIGLWLEGHAHPFYLAAGELERILAAMKEGQ